MARVKVINPYDGMRRTGCEVNGVILRRLYYGGRSVLNDLVARYQSWLRSDRPQAVELETVNRCNNTCSFCPVNVENDDRTYNVMSSDLIEKIGSELQQLEYDGLLALFSNNEPLLDKRIVDICRFFRKKTTAAHIYLYTNGIKLTKDLYLGLFEAGLDELLIDNYDDDLKLIKPVAKLLEEINPVEDPRIQDFKAKTRVMLRKKTEVLTNRGGTAPNKEQRNYRTFEYFQKHSCTLPFIQMVIRPSGEVSLCCQDALGKVTLGDLKKASIQEVWNGKEFREVRRKLKRYGRQSLPLCDVCDVSILYTDLVKRQIRKYLMPRRNSRKGVSQTSTPIPY